VKISKLLLKVKNVIEYVIGMGYIVAKLEITETANRQETPGRKTRELKQIAMLAQSPSNFDLLNN